VATATSASLGVDETSSNSNVSAAVSGCMDVQKTSSNSNPATAVSGSRDDAANPEITQESHEENAPEDEGGQAWARKKRNGPVQSRIGQKSSGMSGFLI
jgi:hypothetical protein